MDSYPLPMHRISVRPDVHHGHPCVAGTRIPVASVLELFREGHGEDAILTDFYPDLTREDLQACLQYAIDVIHAEDVHLAEAG